MLETFPRVQLAHLPTPLEPLPRLSAALGGPDIWIKRDDCTGLATGGNKTRKLEFSLGAAMAEGADTIITAGVVQSNHVRQTAAAACKLGLACEVLLEQPFAEPSEPYMQSGNVLLDKLFGANLRAHPAGTDIVAAMESLADQVRQAGGQPYVIPVGASNATGALGYVDCAVELLGQAEDQGLVIDHLVTATGSAGTQAGLAVGLRAMRSQLPLLGIGVSAARDVQQQKVYALACETAELIGQSDIVARDDIVANCDYIGDGYGLPTTGMNEALLLLARQEGLLLDPVYSGKALAGLVDLTRKGAFDGARNIVFLHTGGSAALFAYLDQLHT